jgi:hypothetical protein
MDKKITGAWQGKRYDYDDLEKQTAQALANKLSILSTESNVVGIKQSFEDEGAILDDVITMRRITEMCGLMMYIKIGGCEAITDINNCVSMGINSIVAPMIETDFALRKFIDATTFIGDIELYFLCESRNSYDNLDSILNSVHAEKLDGIIVGRSDLTKSYGLDKSHADSEKISRIVEDILTRAKNKNLKTTMGGNISSSSIDFIKHLYDKNLLDKIETRNVVVGLNDSNIGDLHNTIKSVLTFEIDWLNFKALNYTSVGNSYLERANTLKGRIG